MSLYSNCCHFVVEFWSNTRTLRAFQTVMAGVAQLVRAPDCGSGGRGFKSRRSPQMPTLMNVRVLDEG